MPLRLYRIALAVTCAGVITLTLGAPEVGAEGKSRITPGRSTKLRSSPEFMTPAPAGGNCTAVVRLPGLMTICDQLFVPDGDIREFVHWRGNSQDYFFTDWFEDNFGKLRDGAVVCADILEVDDDPDFGSNAAGLTGFQDWPRTWDVYSSPTGFNIGRVLLKFDPTLDPDDDPTNGTGVYFIGVDVSAPGPLDLWAFTQPVAFDCDGDGRRTTITEVDPRGVTEAPTFGEDLYYIGVDTNGNGRSEVYVLLGEQRGFAPDETILINPGGVTQMIHGLRVPRYLEFGDATQTLPGTMREQAVRFLDAHNDGLIDWRDIGIGDDLELAILNVTALPRNTDPYHVTFTVRAIAADGSQWAGTQGSSEDQMVVRANFPSHALRSVIPCSDPGPPDE